MAAGRKNSDNFSRKHSFEESVLALQRRFTALHDDTKPPEPRPPEAWLLGSFLSRITDLNPAETDLEEWRVAVHLHDGRTFVGSVLHQHPGSIVLARLGAGPLRIAHRSIR